jgi:uncharacterized Zn finger protein
MELKKFLHSLDISSLATPANFGYGSAICRRNAVELISENETQVEAWAGGLDGSMKEGGGSRRRVHLYIEADKLQHHCTGNPKDHDIFCKHCVAVALYLQKN